MCFEKRDEGGYAANVVLDEMEKTQTQNLFVAFIYYLRYSTWHNIYEVSVHIVRWRL